MLTKPKFDWFLSMSVATLSSNDESLRSVFACYFDDDRDDDDHDEPDNFEDDYDNGDDGDDVDRALHVQIWQQ